MKKDKRLSISITEEQYKYIRTLALARFEGGISAAVRKVINEAIKKPLN